MDKVILHTTYTASRRQPGLTHRGEILEREITKIRDRVEEMIGSSLAFSWVGGSDGWERLIIWMRLIWGWDVMRCVRLFDLLGGP